MQLNQIKQDGEGEIRSNRMGGDPPNPPLSGDEEAVSYLRTTVKYKERERHNFLLFFFFDGDTTTTTTGLFL